MTTAVVRQPSPTTAKSRCHDSPAARAIGAACNAAPRASRGTALIAVLLVATLAFATPCHAAQILVNPGDDWAAKALKAKPGDEIVLMPGRHRPASLDRLVGAPGSPITIRGASKQKPTIITASLDGIRIKQAAHVVIKDLEIVGGSASGIWIAAAASQASEPAASAESSGSSNGTAPPESIEPASATPVLTSRGKDILIENVAISKVGPRGQRHGVFIAGFADVRINNVRVEGWGGSAIELVACEDVTITRCTFRGVKEHSQYCGVRVRAGSDRVSISEARFDNAGDIAVCMGGKSNPEEFVPPLPGDAASGSIAEAARVSVEQSLIVGSRCPLAFIHATDCVVRSTTISRPTRCVLALVNQSPDVRIKPSARNIFGNNLITWKSGDIGHLVEIDQGIDPMAFVLEPNLWWSDDTPEQRAKLGGLPGKPEQMHDQMFDVDPGFAGTFRPTNPAAKSYGAGG